MATNHRDLIHVRLAQNHMATTFELKISCPRERLREADSVLSGAHLLISRLETELTEFREGCAVYTLNRAEPMREIPVAESAIELLELSERARARTQGAFDCAAKSGPLSRAFDKRVDWCLERGKAWRLAIDAHLSFAAIGKGYALDRVRALIEREGFTDYLLNAGGSSIVLSGFSAPNEPWTWGWSWKRDDLGRDLGIPFEHSTGERISIGVSGLHEKGRHLIDPATGEAATGCRSALVGHSSATLADALSTALFVRCSRRIPQARPEFDGQTTKLNESGQDGQTTGLFDECASASIDEAEIPRWNGWFQRFWGSPETRGGVIAAFIFFVFGVARAFADDEAVDLGSMGVSKFNPYLFDRTDWLVGLPAVAIGLVLIHMIKTGPPPRVKMNSSERGKSLLPPEFNIKKGTPP